MTAHHAYHQSLRAMALVSGGWFCFSISDTIIKYLAQSYPLPQILTICNAISFVACAAWLFFHHGGVKGWRSPRWHWHLLRGFVMLGTVICLTNALRLITLADFYGIVFLAPFLATVLSALFLKEDIGWHRILAILFGFCGVLVLAGLHYHSMNIGFLYCFAGAVLLSVNKIIVRKIHNEDPPVYFPLFPSLLIFGTSLPLTMTSYTPPQGGDWFLFLVLSPILLGGMIGFARGFTSAPSVAIVAPFHYTQIIWGVLFGWVLFAEIPSPTTVSGIAIIILSGLYLIWRERAHHRRTIRG